MRIVPFLCALILAAGCGAPSSREEPAKPPPPDNPGNAAPQDEIVAFIDDRPVTLRTVVDHSMSQRGKELIDKYILWKLRRDRLDELGIRNTPEELRRRAQVLVAAWRKEIGEDQFKKYLESRKMTEVSYLETFAGNGEFDEHVRNEKAVVFAVLTEASIEIDAVAFTDREEAAAFTVLASRLSFGEAAERLQTAPSVKGQIGYWPRHRFPRGLAPDVLAAAPELEAKLFTMKKGQTTGVESLKNMHLVISIVETHPAAPATYAGLAERVMAEVLRRPPSKEQTALWMERLLKSKRIRYEDRYTPRNQSR